MGKELNILRRKNQMCKDIFLKCAAQVCDPCERGMEGRQYPIIKVHVCHNKESKPYPGRNGEGHSWVRML